MTTIKNIKSKLPTGLVIFSILGGIGLMCLAYILDFEILLSCFFYLLGAIIIGTPFTIKTLELKDDELIIKRAFGLIKTSVKLNEINSYVEVLVKGNNNSDPYKVLKVFTETKSHEFTGRYIKNYKDFKERITVGKPLNNEWFKKKIKQRIRRRFIFAFTVLFIGLSFGLLLTAVLYSEDEFTYDFNLVNISGTVSEIKVQNYDNQVFELSIYLKEYPNYTFYLPGGIEKEEYLSSDLTTAINVDKTVELKILDEDLEQIIDTTKDQHLEGKNTNFTRIYFYELNHNSKTYFTVEEFTLELSEDYIISRNILIGLTTFFVLISLMVFRRAIKKKMKFKQFELEKEMEAR